MEWTISPGAPGALKIEVAMDVLERFDAQEYHASVLLTPRYTRWETASESGQFPEIDPKVRDWVHLNSDFRSGGFLRASGAGLPRLTIKPDASAPHRLTALNTDYMHGARVLQALATPDHGLFSFEPGRHPYFSGTISVSLD